MIGKIVIVIFVIIMATYINSTGFTDSKPALKMTITTGLNENNTVTITNMTFEQTTVPFYYKRVDSPTQFPEISVYARTNDKKSDVISFWSAVKRTSDDGIYTLTMTFRDGKEPNPEEMLILAVKLTDFKGKQIYKTTAFYGWEN